jgi:hypothetical protein
MKAVMRVNKPSVNSTPPTSSSTPDRPIRENSSTVPVSPPEGKAKNLDVPCSMNSNPTTMRTTLSSRGAQFCAVVSIVDKMRSPAGGCDWDWPLT